MKISISYGNTKMGKIPSISLPPIKSCGNCSKCAKHCYAKQAYLQYKCTRDAYDRNLAILKNDPQDYFHQIYEFINKSYDKNKPIPFFRWHVSGDILDLNYFNAMVTFAYQFQETNFLVFTKMYNIVDEYLIRYSIPLNLKIFYSVWLDEEIDNPCGISIARTVNKGETNKYEGFKCEGNCEQCMACFESKPGSKVIFEMH